MTIDLSSFGDDIRAVIIGASGGIGGALASTLKSHTSAAEVITLSRPDIDLTDEASIEKAATGLEGKFDLILVATGLLHGDGIQPEKSLRDLCMDNFEKSFAVNAFGPALVAKHFLPLLNAERKSVFAAVSARVGSISDNRLGGWYAYRASKAALNMLLKTAAIETARKNKTAAVIGLHPGTVDTDLSKPFQGNVPDEQLFTPDYSAEKLLTVINSATAGESGSLFAWDGEKIPF